MEQAYAQALWKVVEDGMTPKEAVAELREVLTRLGRITLLPKIARAFARIAARDSARNNVVLSIAHKKDERGAKRDVKQFLSDVGAEPRDVTVTMDDSLIGGWRLEGNERLVDASFKKHLLSMYNRATQS